MKGILALIWAIRSEILCECKHLSIEEVVNKLTVNHRNHVTNSVRFYRFIK